MYAPTSKIVPCTAAMNEKITPALLANEMLDFKERPEITRHS